MGTLRKKRWLINALTFCFLSLGPSAVFAEYSKPVNIAIPSLGNVQHLSQVVPKYKKFYDEMGITHAQIIVLRGNAVTVQALISGSIHFGTPLGPAMMAMARGEQLRILLQTFSQQPFALITRPEINRLEDLKSAKIAVTFGGSTYSVLLALFARHGLAANFAEYLNIPDNPSKAVALMQGRVSAALMAPPTDRSVLKAGFKRLVYLGEEFKGIPASALITTAKLVREEPDLVGQVVKAIVKGMLYIREDREGAIEQIMSYGKTDREEAASLHALMRDAFIPALELDAITKRWELETATLKERPSFNPKPFMDDRFLKAALRSLGRSGRLSSPAP